MARTRSDPAPQSEQNDQIERLYRDTDPWKPFIEIHRGGCGAGQAARVNDSALTR
jgi:hypothetical protein